MFSEVAELLYVAFLSDNLHEMTKPLFWEK